MKRERKPASFERRMCTKCFKMRLARWLRGGVCFPCRHPRKKAAAENAPSMHVKGSQQRALARAKDMLGAAAYVRVTAYGATTGQTEWEVGVASFDNVDPIGVGWTPDEAFADAERELKERRAGEVARRRARSHTVIRLAKEP